MITFTSNNSVIAFLFAELLDLNFFSFNKSHSVRSTNIFWTFDILSFNSDSNLLDSWTLFHISSKIFAVSNRASDSGLIWTCLSVIPRFKMLIIHFARFV